MTRTFAILHISQQAWDEIYLRLEKIDSLDIPCCGQIDMHGIALQASEHLGPTEKIKVLRYPPADELVAFVEEIRNCIWCGAQEGVDPDADSRLCQEGSKQGYVSPCHFDEAEVPLHQRKIERVQRPSVGSEPLPYDHDGARLIRELDGRGTE